jgi:hypothetical protein
MQMVVESSQPLCKTKPTLKSKHANDTDISGLTLRANDGQDNSALWVRTPNKGRGSSQVNYVLCKHKGQVKSTTDSVNTRVKSVNYVLCKHEGQRLASSDARWQRDACETSKVVAEVEHPARG